MVHICCQKTVFDGQQAIYTLLPSTQSCWQNDRFLKHLQRVKTDENPMEQSQGCMLDILRSQSVVNGVFQWCGEVHCHATIPHNE
jgi:hypothetical protein